MPSGKRTRERQLAKLAARRAAERRRRRRRRLLAGAVAAAVALGGLGGGLVALTGGSPRPGASPTPSPTAPPGGLAACGFTASGAPSGDRGALSPPDSLVDRSRSYRATIRTSMGTIRADLFDDQAPCAVTSFVYLARRGFYDGLTFHRVVRDFVIQDGDPTGSGSGGPGYRFNDELDNDLTYRPGTLAMANSGPDTNGSQWFIVASRKGARQLTKSYTIFGEVTSGMDVVRRINRVAVDRSDRPLQDVTVRSVTIREVAAPA